MRPVFKRRHSARARTPTKAAKCKMPFTDSTEPDDLGPTISGRSTLRAFRTLFRPGR
jgi:hypothetical protein